MKVVGQAIAINTMGSKAARAYENMSTGIHSVGPSAKGFFQEATANLFPKALPRQMNCKDYNPSLLRKQNWPKIRVLILHLLT
jgi:hypothetical protein